MAAGTRIRIMIEALRLFGEQGFSATSVAQIELAAGLSPGSGGLYKHFASKDELLAAAIRERIENRGELLQTMTEPPRMPAEQLLLAIASQGLARLDDERDLNRVLVRDLATRPELLRYFRERELQVTHAALVEVLTGLGAADPAALGAILIDALSHYWLMADLFGNEHPLGISRERYLAALAHLAAQELP